MTFYAYDAAVDSDGIRRELLPIDRFGDAAPSSAGTAGEAAA
ncbi:hypothetical protein [Microbacterium capsulatum]|uniref:Uncharacterized protein n=1 Tax=Microbacterium capsulatum TaxID=3041921 RepID=A0ABU0XKY7_9MICO|nr:hypothetical protein [Microbacterium sp. ASV81]MDQ4215816.1 hypothetical protein [Microbacterium sp. ASV81]